MKDYFTKMVSRLPVGGGERCGVLQKGSLLGVCQEKVSETIAAILGHQKI